MEYIFPNPHEKLLILTKDDDYQNEISMRLCEKSNLYKKVHAQLSFPFHQSALRLNQCTRNLMKDTMGPNVLFLSDNEGGFAKKGIRIKAHDGIKDYKDLNYVDLVLDEERVDEGELHIFTHELGHVMMNNIIDNLPSGKNTKQHISVGITDYYTAFSEGWAIQFERLAYDSIPFYKKSSDSKYDYNKEILKLWQCEADSKIRLEGVLKNIFINKKLIPDIDISTMDIKDMIILEHTSPIFDKTRLKNAQEMLSNEGVIATLFYRITTSEALKKDYMPKDHYNDFLLSDLSDDDSIENLFTPFENVILKSLWIFKEIKNKLTDSSIPFIEFINCWCDHFPNDRSEIIRIFITTTVGKTITNELSDVYEKTAYKGMVGKIDDVIHGFKDYKKILGDICRKVEQGILRIDSNIGSELWVENKSVEIPSCFWSDEETNPLMINLNTASPYELMSLYKIDINKSNEIIKKRDLLGYFKSVDSLEKLL